MEDIDAAINWGRDDHDDDEPPSRRSALRGDELTAIEVAGEEGDESTAPDARHEWLLDRLLYKGVLPRYAFPTDVATFHVFGPRAFDAVPAGLFIHARPRTAYRPIAVRSPERKSGSTGSSGRREPSTLRFRSDREDAWGTTAPLLRV